MYRYETKKVIVLLDAMREKLEKGSSDLELRLDAITQDVRHIEHLYQHTEMNGKEKLVVPSACIGIESQISKIEQEIDNLRCMFAVFESNLLINKRQAYGLSLA